jgi:DNA-binding response OmpR family regulator
MAPIRVFIIDDEPETVTMFKAFLKLFDIEAEGAYTGVGGLAAIAANRPDVLILDLMLPDADGYEICKQLRSQPETATLPIIIVSARTAREDVRRGYAVGATRYLKKPVDLDKLLAEVQAAARAGRHEPPPEAVQEADAGPVTGPLPPLPAQPPKEAAAPPKAKPAPAKTKGKSHPPSPYPEGFKLEKDDTRPIPGQYYREKDEKKDEG